LAKKFGLENLSYTGIEKEKRDNKWKYEMINRSKESFELIIDIGIFFLHDFDFVCGFIFLDLL